MLKSNLLKLQAEQGINKTKIDRKDKTESKTGNRTKSTDQTKGIGELRKHNIENRNQSKNENTGRTSAIQFLCKVDFDNKQGVGVFQGELIYRYPYISTPP